MSRGPSPGVPRRRAPAKLRIEVVVRSARWKRQPDAATIVRKFVSAAAIAASTPRAELAIVLTDDSAIRALNRQWRGLDAPTNVLSFPAARADLSARPRESERAKAKPAFLGDIVIAYQTVAREARQEGKPFANHLAHLAVHGFLHLLGHDHDTGRKARRMERLEVAILSRLRVPDPYTHRSGA